MSKPTRLANLTTNRLEALVDGERPVVGLVPVGSVEPHGPHLPLQTDTIISRAAIDRATPRLEERGWEVLETPAVEYGVTDCASGFAGAVSISADRLTAYLDDLVEALLGEGLEHVCLVNNHLEPDHDEAVRSAVRSRDPAVASVATPLKKKWARRLSDEFKSGACHAGKYETSILLAAAPERVERSIADELDTVPVSLSEKLREGIADFVEMGLTDAYAGAPSEASVEHGDEMLDRLADMIAGEVSGPPNSNGAE